ncbi:MAG: HD domain-containing phosphohydrolase [Solirubrobacteraceae bacterium]
MPNKSAAQTADHRIGRIRARPSKLVVPLVVLMLTIGAIAGVWTLVGRASSSRVAQLQVSSMKLALADLQRAPFAADPAGGGSPQASAVRIQRDEQAISSGLTVGAQPGVPLSLLQRARANLAPIESLVTNVYQIALHDGLSAGGAAVELPLSNLMNVRGVALTGVLSAISRTDAARAVNSRTDTKLEAAIAMLLLLAAFAYFYLRSVAAHEAVERLAGEKEALLGVSRGEARTDALTSLRNRRALTTDLASAISESSDSEELLLAMFDLDGFKQYNDTFGHPAGDALLQRLGGRLAAAAAQHSGSAYRMGGDEFCVLARWSPTYVEQLLNDAICALEDSGEGWQIGCSHGVAWIPAEAVTESQALALADERLYANKASRSSTSRQVTDALLQVLTEQSASLDDHVERVSEFAAMLAIALDLPELEVQRIRLAAKLHDIGKTAIPAAILDKPAPLDEHEWAFMRRHPGIGARIVSAAPALAHTAALIHASHERIDGNGYPDGLAGDEIPLGSRIIAVCDAFEAMTSDRLYRPAVDIDAAFEELRRHANAQFDERIVEVFCNSIAPHCLTGSDRGRPVTEPGIRHAL